MSKKKISYFIVFITLLLISCRPLFAASPVKTDHFKIMGFGGIEEEKLKRIGRDCESSYAELLAFFGVDPYKSGKIQVNVYTKPQGGKGIIASAGAQQIDLYMGFNDKKVLNHVLTYIVIYKALPSAPKWFREGFALYLEYGDIRKDRTKSRLPFKDFSFTRLEARFSTHIGEEDAYYYSWSIVSYLMDVYGKEKLNRIFKESGSFSDKFSKAYGVKLKDIEEKADYIFANYKPNG
jgi:hypothetical protein